MPGPGTPGNDGGFGTIAASFPMRPCFFGPPTRACSRTSFRFSTGTISIFPTYRSSRRTSFMFDFGIRTLRMPISAAASIFAVTPPTGRTCPRTLREPVIATLWSTSTPSRALITAVATEIDALSPSVPSRLPTNWTWMSWFEMSSPVYFLIRAATFSTASFAMSPRRPVAMIFPPFFTCAGVTSAAIGRTIPLNSAIVESPLYTASPFTTPATAPSVTNVLYSFPRSMIRSATCCSRDRAIFFPWTTCVADTRGAPCACVEFPRRDEDEVARARLRLHHRAARPLALSDDGELLLLEGGEEALLAFDPQDVDLVDEQDALVGRVDRARLDPFVGGGLEPAALEGVVLHIPEERARVAPRPVDERRELVRAVGDEELPDHDVLLSVARVPGRHPDDFR